ncbi:MAG: MerR family transcriptional regulator [Acidaminobacteraceae bacterium]
MYKIGELSLLVNMSIDAIRYYEKVGLIKPPTRLNKYRIYDEAYVKQLEFIKKIKALGFTLVEIKELFSIIDLPATECRTIHGFMSEKAEFIDKKIRELQLLKEAILDISANCHEEYGIVECPIIEELINNS